MIDTVNVSVIGNISAGKTSFLRTLMREPNKGIVGVRVTTNSVDDSFRDDNNLISFLDTPGFKNAKKVSDWVAKAKEPFEIPSPQKIVDVIKTNDPNNTMKHDIDAWESLINADVVLYLVDITRNPTAERNLEASYKLLPANSILIFTHLPQDEQILLKYRKPWENLKQMCGSKGVEFVEFDALHRSYDSEMEILNLIEKRTRSSKEKSIKRYINNRKSDEEARLRQSFEMLIALIDRLSKIKSKADGILISDIPNSDDKEQIVDYVFNSIKEDLSNKITDLLKRFCKSILYIWGFRSLTSCDQNDLNGTDLLPEFGHKDPDANVVLYAMYKLVDINTTIISNSIEVTDNNESKITIKSCFEEFKIREKISWGYEYFSFIPRLPRIGNADGLPPVWSINPKIDGSVSLNSNMDFINSFIPCALDFIKKVRERGIATPIKEKDYNNHHNLLDEECHKEYTIPFIMPTEKMFKNIDQPFKEFKWNWKSQQAAKDEWIPDLLKAFDMKQDS